MHLSTKKISLLGLLLAISVILNILSGIIETSTLFLLSASSFLIGVAFRESSKILGVGFYLACVLLSFILAPNKLYCITFSLIGLYIVFIELLRNKLCKNKIRLFVSKLILFNIIYIPILLFFPQLFIARELNAIIRLIFLVFGQAGFLIYDKAYDYFMVHYWGRYRR